MNYYSYLFFWGHTRQNGYLSNFYPASFKDESLTYNCSEQYFMKKKQELFDPTNVKLAKQIMSEYRPTKIKQYGRMVKNYDEKKWTEVRYNIMLDANILKFKQNDYLLQELLKTTNDVIVEASPRDKIWGIGLSESAARKIAPQKWPGYNLLGKALMETRDKLNIKKPKNK